MVQATDAAAAAGDFHDNNNHGSDERIAPVCKVGNVETDSTADNTVLQECNNDNPESTGETITSTQQQQQQQQQADDENTRMMRIEKEQQLVQDDQNNLVNTASTADTERGKEEPWQCTVYMAKSTIPGAGLGIFTAIPRQAGETLVHMGDISIPVVDLSYHYSAYASDEELAAHPDLYDPTFDYIWYGPEMLMQHEASHPHEQCNSFSPGLDAAINCHLAVINTSKGVPVWDDLHEQVRRNRGDAGVGAFSPYLDCPTFMVADTPAGGELFKYYGDHYFVIRPDSYGDHFPLTDDYVQAEAIIDKFHQDVIIEKTNEDGSIIQEALPDHIQEDLWNMLLSTPGVESRTLNALPKSWQDCKYIHQHGIFAYYQSKTIRPVPDLERDGRCLDNIRHAPSTLVPQAGRGAFATRFIQKGEIVTGTPLLFIPNADFFRMHDADNWRDKHTTPHRQRLRQYQLLVNYCWHNHQASLFLCPYGALVQFINHNVTLQNVQMQWVQNDGEMEHKAALLQQSPVAMEHSFDLKDYHPAPGLFMDIVATRDIPEGEEIFLNYGTTWEEAWQAHVKKWQQHGPPPPPDYIPPRVWNERHAKDVLRTVAEQEQDPYPDYFQLFCLSHIIELEDGQDFLDSRLALSLWAEGMNPIPCSILERRMLTKQEKLAAGHGGVGRASHSYLYKVEYLANAMDEDGLYVHVDVQDDDEEEEEWYISGWMVREAMAFFDVPYTSDIYLKEAFRHPVGIPDEIFPPAWIGYDSGRFPDPWMTTSRTTTSSDENDKE